jgi:uncharacterized protein YidB (DUF937 family)
MSIFDAVTNLVSGLSGSGNSGGTPDHAAITSGLLEELGAGSGIGNLIQSFQQNGGGSLVQEIASGNTSAIDPNQLEGLLAGTGLIDNVAARTGISSDQIKSGLGSIVPLLINHGVSSGHVTADGQPGPNPAPDASSLLSSVLGKLA